MYKKHTSQLQKKHKAYIHSGTWRDIRNSKLEINPLCEVCFSNIDIRIHHRRYIKDDEIIYGNEDIVTDLISLCERCHNKWHKTYKLLETTDERFKEFCIKIAKTKIKDFASSKKKKVVIKKKIKQKKKWNTTKGKKANKLKVAYIFTPIQVDTKKSIKKMLEL